MEVALRGAGGEPVDLARTVRSHGLTDLPPMRLLGAPATAAAGPGVDRVTRPQVTQGLEVTVALPRGRPRTVRIAAGRPGYATATILGRRPGPPQVEAVRERVAYVLRLDEDLSGFYARAAADPALSWATAGAGRLARAATVFEEITKTICTTNCSWSATERMVAVLVAELGEPAAGAPHRGPYGRAFPTPAAMAAADAAFYRDRVKAGYRGRYLRGFADEVVHGRVDVEGLAAPELTDEQVEARLLALPGIGPYAAAHVMLLLGRYSRLVLDSWTRPTYARLVGRRHVPDAQIRDRFARYGPWAGLAFWLVLTRGWVP